MSINKLKIQEEESKIEMKSPIYMSIDSLFLGR
jgi:hypothetical protein